MSVKDTEAPRWVAIVWIATLTCLVVFVGAVVTKWWVTVAVQSLDRVAGITAEAVRPEIEDEVDLKNLAASNQTSGDKDVGRESVGRGTQSREEEPSASLGGPTDEIESKNLLAAADGLERSRKDHEIVPQDPNIDVFHSCENLTDRATDASQGAGVAVSRVIGYCEPASTGVLAAFSIRRETPVEILAATDGFYMVRYGTAIGYSRKYNITPSTPQSAAVPSANPAGSQAGPLGGSHAPATPGQLSTASATPRPSPSGAGQRNGGQFTVTIVSVAATVSNGTTRLELQVRQSSVNYDGRWASWIRVLGASYLTVGGRKYHPVLQQSEGWHNGEVQPGDSRGGSMVFLVDQHSKSLGRMTLSFAFYPEQDQSFVSIPFSAD